MKDRLSSILVQTLSFVAFGSRSGQESVVVCVSAFTLAVKTTPMARHALTLRLANLESKFPERTSELEIGSLTSHTYFEKPVKCRDT